MQMRIFLTIILVALSAFSFSQEMDPIEKVSNPTLITASNASTFSSYDNTLESVVNYFFASQIRKDKEWEKVVSSPQEQTELMQHILHKYETRTITKFQLSGKVEHQKGKFWVFVNVEMVDNGRTNKVFGRVEVELINSKLVITGGLPD